MHCHYIFRSTISFRHFSHGKTSVSLPFQNVFHSRVGISRCTQNASNFIDCFVVQGRDARVQRLRARLAHLIGLGDRPVFDLRVESAEDVVELGGQKGIFIGSCSSRRLLLLVGVQTLALLHCRLILDPVSVQRLPLSLEGRRIHGRIIHQPLGTCHRGFEDVHCPSTGSFDCSRGLLCHLDSVSLKDLGRTQYWVRPAALV